MTGPTTDAIPKMPPKIPWTRARVRSEEHTSELQSRSDLVCRLLLEKKKKATKSDWSWTRAYEPRGLYIRRWRNAHARSPRSATTARDACAPNSRPTGPNGHQTVREQ